jgi:Na+/H+-translocating membrane pyrophosphatase
MLLFSIFYLCLLILSNLLQTHPPIKLTRPPPTSTQQVISAMILGGTLAKQASLPSASGFILFPLVVHSLDLVASAAGIMSIEAKPPASALPNEDPYAVMKGGYFVAVGVSAVGFVAACRLMLWAPHAPGAWAHFAGCGMIGAATAVAFVWISQYYTDTKVCEGTLAPSGRAVNALVL